MAWTHIESKAAATGGSAIWGDSTQAIVLAAACSAGDIVVVMCRVRNETITLNTPTDNAGTTYTAVTNSPWSHSDAGLFARIYCWRGVAAVGAQTVTVTSASAIGGANEQGEMIVRRFTVAVGATVTVDPTPVSASDGGGTHDSGNITTTGNDSLLLGAVEADGPRTWTIDADFLEGDTAQDDFAGMMGYKILTTTATHSYTTTASGSADALNVLIALKETAGGGGGSAIAVKAGHLRQQRIS